MFSIFVQVELQNKCVNGCELQHGTTDGDFKKQLNGK